MPLTAMAVSKARPRDKPYKLADMSGLYLLVTPQGGRYWRLNYRHGGKQRTLALGVFPDVSLADARGQRDAARKLLAAGEDPIARKRRDELEASLSSAATFRAVAEEWFAKVEKEGRAAITLAKIKWLLGFAYPVIGERPIADISAQELLAVLRSVSASRSVIHPGFGDPRGAATGDRLGQVPVPELLHAAASDVGEYAQSRSTTAGL